MANEASERLKLVGWAFVLAVLAYAGLAVFVLVITGTAVVLVSVGIPMLMVTFPVVRWYANFHRRWAGRMLGTPIPSSYRPRPPGNALVRLWATARDRATWRDVLWLF